jgi:hypothetical protein
MDVVAMSGYSRKQPLAWMCTEWLVLAHNRRPRSSFAGHLIVWDRRHTTRYAHGNRLAMAQILFRSSTQPGAYLTTTSAGYLLVPDMVLRHGKVRCSSATFPAISTPLTAGRLRGYLRFKRSSRRVLHDIPETRFCC